MELKQQRILHVAIQESQKGLFVVSARKLACEPFLTSPLGVFCFSAELNDTPLM